MLECPAPESPWSAQPQIVLECPTPREGGDVRSKIMILFIAISIPIGNLCESLGNEPSLLDAHISGILDEHIWSAFSPTGLADRGAWECRPGRVQG